MTRSRPENRRFAVSRARTGRDRRVDSSSPREPPRPRLGLPKRQPQPRTPRGHGPSWRWPCSAGRQLQPPVAELPPFTRRLACPVAWTAAPSASSALAGRWRRSRLPRRGGRRTSSVAWRPAGRRAGGRLAGGRSGREVGKTWEETARRGARLADRADPHALFACAGAPGAPQGAGFCLGPPAPVSARAGEKRVSGGRLGRFFGAGAKKKRLGKACWGRGWRCF